ncbi:MAG TPA: serine/threonine-protein kinase, partial [Coleofasciculaceae cyanobacterium]
MSSFPDFSGHGYHIEKELGSNRTGGRVTYLAKHIRSRKKVVIKQFQFAQSLSSWSDYDAYDREIQVLRGLKHPGIPRYLDSFQTPDGFCMVQEYKNALSLDVPRSFNPNEIQKIAISLLEILVYLQNRIPPVIHRDIKPANILVDEQCNVYLIDFGFARIGDGEVGISSVVKGTLGFMPPEQLFNRKLTEASDLYGLGMTLICLLTGTKSDDIGNLVDISYRIDFKHLVPKLSFHWIKWLEKMVEPRLKERYPNAAAALDAMPTYPMSLPKAQLSQSNFELKAISIGEKLSQIITIENPVPETILKGWLEVAPHPHDPPHTPHAHSWISFEPKEFEGNQIQCKITAHTNQLMADKHYNRKILLHSNCSSEPYSIALQVHTASIPIQTKNLTYGVLTLLFLFSLVVAWIISYSILISASVADDLIAASFGTIAGAIIGFEASAWVMGAAGATTGATTGVVAGIALGMVAWAMVWNGFVAAAGAVAIAGTIAGLIGGMTFGVGTGLVAEKLMEREFSKSFAIWLSLLTTAAGSSLGLGLGIGFLNSVILWSVIGTNLPLVGMMIHFP